MGTTYTSEMEHLREDMVEGFTEVIKSHFPVNSSDNDYTLEIIETEFNLESKTIICTMTMTYNVTQEVIIKNVPMFTLEDELLRAILFNEIIIENSYFERRRERIHASFDKYLCNVMDSLKERQN